MKISKRDTNTCEREIVPNAVVGYKFLHLRHPIANIFNSTGWLDEHQFTTNGQCRYAE